MTSDNKGRFVEAMCASRKCACAYTATALPFKGRRLILSADERCYGLPHNTQDATPPPPLAQQPGRHSNPQHDACLYNAAENQQLRWHGDSRAAGARGRATSTRSAPTSRTPHVRKHQPPPGAALVSSPRSTRGVRIGMRINRSPRIGRSASEHEGRRLDERSRACEST